MRYYPTLIEVREGEGYIHPEWIFRVLISTELNGIKIEILGQIYTFYTSAKEVQYFFSCVNTFSICCLLNGVKGGPNWRYTKFLDWRNKGRRKKGRR